MSKPKLVAKPPKPTQRELDQETTISTMRLLMATMIRKFGTLDTVYLTRPEIERVKDGDMRIRDDAKGIHLAIKVGTGPLIGMGPKLVSH